MSDYMGKMHIVKYPCGHVVAACWVTGNEKDAAYFKRKHVKRGNDLETIERYVGDPAPEWCHSDCDRLAS